MPKPYQYTLTNITVMVMVDGEPITVSVGSPNFIPLRLALINENWAEVPQYLSLARTVERWASSASAQTPPSNPRPVVGGDDVDDDVDDDDVDDDDVDDDDVDDDDVDEAPTSRTTTAVAPKAASTAPTSRTTIAAAPEAPKGEVKVIGNTVTLNGEPLPPPLTARILKAISTGANPDAFINFWKRLKCNPNPHSVKQLWDFLEHNGIPIQPDGTLLAYKGVRLDFRDQHSGTLDNSPGKTVRMDRTRISTDPNKHCHAGLHVGALGYARGFAVQTVIVRVDPEHVCCVPNDHDAQKMRVCEYTVMGLYSQALPDTVYDAQEESAVEVAEAAPIVETPDREEAPEVAQNTIPLTGTQWDRLNDLDSLQLMSESLEDLRKYARYNCLIPKASKLLGGKEALIAKIIEVRNRGTKPEPEPEVKIVETLVAPDVVIPGAQETPRLPSGQASAVSLPLLGTQWDRLNDLNSLQLMSESLEDLRKYATYNCLMVGASKLPGGKMALVTRICAIRGDATFNTTD